ncbi:MAG TPA: hypothetical protein VMU47_06650 [Caldimonas sp.]|nr:hypothetical protein [Caldimonas sp.]
MPSCGAIDIYDGQNGSVLVAWPAFPGITPASYNVYVNGVLNQNVAAPARQATITGLSPASYNASAAAPAGNGSARPESLPPVGVITDAHTYDIKIVAVVGGVEVAASMDRTVTVQPQSNTLTTPMRRGPFPFPSTPGGY